MRFHLRDHFSIKGRSRALNMCTFGFFLTDCLPTYPASLLSMLLSLVIVFLCPQIKLFDSPGVIHNTGQQCIRWLHDMQNIRTSRKSFTCLNHLQQASTPSLSHVFPLTWTQSPSWIIKLYVGRRRERGRGEIVWQIQKMRWPLCRVAFVVTAGLCSCYLCSYLSINQTKNFD